MAVKNYINQYGIQYDLADGINIAEQELTSIASKRHAVGSYFIYNGILYITTVEILVGNTIIPDTNCKHVKLAEQINQEAIKKADVNDMAKAFVEIDQNNNNIQDMKEQINELKDYTQNLSDKMLVKADVVDVTNLIIENDFRINDIKQLDDKIKMKAEAVDLATLATEIEKIDELKNELDSKVELTNLATLAIEIDKLDISKLDKMDAARQSEIASLYSELDLVDVKANNLDTNIRSLQVLAADIRAEKINKPTEGYGVSGQVLVTNGNGTTSWDNPTVPTSEQIGEAVSTWLEEHPEATTTVENGSITEEKLSTEVLELIGTGEDKDAQVLINGFINDVNAKLSLDSNIVNNNFIMNLYKSQLETHASRYLNDGFGFVFFTDPHNLTGWFGATPYSLMNDLQYIRIIKEHTPSEYVFCGGDWLNVEHITLAQSAWLVGRVQNLMQTEIGSKAYTVFGNHDDNTESGQGSGYNLTQAQLGRMWYNNNTCYFILDATKDLDIYMLEIDYSLSAISTNQRIQLEWIAAQLQNNTKTHIFGIGHMLMSESPYFGEALCSIIDAFNRKTTIVFNNNTYSYINVPGTWHFLIGGHEHIDTDRIQSNIPIIITRNFFNNRTVDLVYADWNNSKLYLDRIGYGDSRIINIIPTGNYQVNE